MNAGTTVRRVLGGSVCVALLAGCAATTTQSPQPTAASPSATQTPVAMPSPTPIATATRTAVAHGPAAVVTGTEDCGDLDPVWTTDPAGSMHARNQTIHCTDTTDDLRVTGSHVASWSMDAWGDLNVPAAAGFQWGTVRLENTGGAWEGRFTGVASLPEPGDTIAIWYEGTGGYAGLSYFELITGPCCVYQIQGQIFPGDPPNLASVPLVAVATPQPSAAASPTTTQSPAQTAVSYGPVTVVAGTETCMVGEGSQTTDAAGIDHFRDVPVRCTDTMNDPRVTGTITGIWNADNWGGANVQWGVVRLQNAGGAWEGRVTGVWSEDRGDSIVFWWTGTGGYEGLAYFSHASGWAPWKVEGQVFPGDPPTL